MSFVFNTRRKLSNLFEFTVNIAQRHGREMISFPRRAEQ